MRAPGLFLILCLAMSAVGEDLSCDPKIVAQQSNGISVGKPKAFDNRTLTIMLEGLSQQLQGMQSFVDQKALATALTNLQGSRSIDVATALSLGSLPLPSTKVETKANTGNASEEGVALADSTELKTITERAAFTPTAPTLATAPTSGFSPTFGQAGGDLLSDQINLSYQIFNLRMILERSLSDRLIDESPRMQAVLGFNVTIEAPRTAVDGVAVVEVTLKAAEPKAKDGKESGAEALSLVALMPQEKTYNAATFSTKSNAFGGTAVVNMMQVGASTRRQAQTFYLYRDNDTIAYERMNPTNPNEIIFGWMFRPVLGRRAVTPGFRQMFAVVALPKADRCGQECPKQLMDASVRTFWKKYDADTLTSFENHDANRAARFRYAVTFGLTKPEIFDARYANARNYCGIEVKTTSKYDGNLAPEVKQVTWTPVGAKSALVSATGSNFFTGTQVMLGDKKYAAGDGLVLKSNDSFELTTTLDALSSGPAVISGRYGAAIPFAADDKEQPGAVVIEAPIGPSLSGTRSVEVVLQSRFDENGTVLPLAISCPPRTANAAPLKVACLPQDLAGDLISPLITINGNTVPLPYLPYQRDEVVEGYVQAANTRQVEKKYQVEKKQYVVFRGTIPDSFMSGGTANVRVSWPFLSSRWTSQIRVPDPSSAYQIVRVGEKTFILQSKNTSGFVKQTKDDRYDLEPTACWRLFAGDSSFILKTAACPGGDAKQSESLSKNSIAITPMGVVPDKVVLLDPMGAVYSLDVPKVTQPDPAPAKAVSVTQFDSVFVDYTVKDASKIALVEANQMSLKFVPKSKDEGEKIIRVLVTRELSAKPGTIELTMIDKEGNTTNPKLIINPCANCKTE